MPHVSKGKLQTRCAAASKKRKASLATRQPKDDTPKDNTRLNGSYTRAHFDYSFARLETRVRAGLDSVSLQIIRRFSMRSKRWMIAYPDGGMGSVEREFAEKLYRSHRREPNMIGINSRDPSVISHH